MRMRLAAMLLLVSVPSVAQIAPQQSMDQAPASMDQEQWGILTELVGRDFEYHNSMLVTFRWIESVGYVEMTYWGLGGRTTFRLQPDPAGGVIKLLNVGAVGTSTVDRLRTATDGALLSLKRASEPKPWLEGGLAGGVIMNGIPLVPVAAGSAQARKVERLIAEGKLSRGAPLTQSAAAVGDSDVVSLGEAEDPATLAEFEAEPEPEPEIEIDPETGAVKQTPAGAIRFLDTLAQQGSLTILHHYQAWPSFTLSSKLQRVRRGNDCQAQFLGRPEFISLSNSGSFPAGTPEFESALRQISGMYRHEPLPWIVDWSRISEVSFGGLSAKHPNDQQTVVLSGTRAIALRLPNQALAKRVHYAVLFLKERCDPTADTGF